MNENRFDTTAANVLSSLRVRGASVAGGVDKGGFVPVLGSDGTLDMSVMPSNYSTLHVDIDALKNTAFVDANASYPSGVNPTGSIAKPFKTLQAAASAGFTDFVLVGGAYGVETVSCSNMQNTRKIRIFSLGQSTFDALTLNGYMNGASFEFSNVSVLTTLMFSGQLSCSLSLLDNGHVGTLRALNDASVSALVDAGFVVEHTLGDVAIELAASSDRIANGSSVSGETVSDALSALGARMIRVPVFTYDDEGVHADGYTDVPATNGLYSLLGLANIANSVNSVFHKDGDSVEYSDVTADSVTANTVAADSVSTQSVKFSADGPDGTVVSVDSGNFLVVTQPPVEED